MDGHKVKVKKCIKYLLDIDLSSILNNNILNLILAMKFAVNCPPSYWGLITSTGFAGRSFFILERKEVML
jgi:hypothetical protein